MEGLGLLWPWVDGRDVTIVGGTQGKENRCHGRNVLEEGGVLGRDEKLSHPCAFQNSFLDLPSGGV